MSLSVKFGESSAPQVVIFPNTVWSKGEKKDRIEVMFDGDGINPYLHFAYAKPTSGSKDSPSDKKPELSFWDSLKWVPLRVKDIIADSEQWVLANRMSLLRLGICHISEADQKDPTNLFAAKVKELVAEQAQLIAIGQCWKEISTWFNTLLSERQESEGLDTDMPKITKNITQLTEDNQPTAVLFVIKLIVRIANWILGKAKENDKLHEFLTNHSQKVFDFVIGQYRRQLWDQQVI